MTSHQLTLYPSAPYDFQKTVERLKAHHEMFVIEAGHTVVRTIRPGLEGSPVLMRASSVGSVSAPQIDVQIIGSAFDERKLRQRLAHMFTVHMDIASFYRTVRHDAKLCEVIDQLYGLRLITDADLFESMVRTIIGQQVTVSFASTLTKRLAALAAEPLVVDGIVYPVFPSPLQVAALSVSQLRALQFSTRKAEYIIDFAKLVCEGKLDLDGLYELDDDQVMAQLLPIRGVGRWTVECLLLFGMGRENLLPAADIGLRNAVRNVYGLDRQATEEEVRKLGDAWIPYRSYATFYLWETL